MYMDKVQDAYNSQDFGNKITEHYSNSMSSVWYFDNFYDNDKPVWVDRMSLQEYVLGDDWEDLSEDEIEDLLRPENVVWYLRDLTITE